MQQKPRYYFTERWFKDIIYAVSALLNVYVAMYGIGLGGMDGYLIAFAAGSAVYFLGTNFMKKDGR